MTKTKTTEHFKIEEAQSEIRTRVLEIRAIASDKLTPRWKPGRALLVPGAPRPPKEGRAKSGRNKVFQSKSARSRERRAWAACSCLTASGRGIGLKCSSVVLCPGRPMA